ncbi:LacI family DNA-binding transcriptional regulator [Chelatococcus asaccharovorans]|uniref:LacI family DNA-binding transcriptional regulator n=1 Tax=Chelatococcus asaccharovorans TaxID=28210 RepID=UPI0022651254|nr:LacI family DNA-binding transcriptional regulator [Chelatococcus asaccharovorans]
MGKRARTNAEGRRKMEDVARLTGVSLSTVSRVIREPHRVAEPTRLKVETAIASTGYVPNLVASSLKSERSRLVACVVPSVEHSFIADVVRGASEVLRPQGFQLMLATSDFRPEEEEDVVHAFLSRRPDAIILTGLTHTDRTRAMLGAAGIPVVEVGNLSDQPIDMVVGFSNREAQKQLTTAMIDAGRRHIGYLLHDGSAQNERSRDRYNGYRAALTERGIACDDRLTTEVEFSYRGGAVGLGQLLAQGRPIDALCCSNDIIALGALYELQRRGIAVPDTIAIAGFDDHEASSQCVPPLSTVRIPRLLMGREAGRLIEQTLAGEPPTSKIVDVGFALQIRQTF